MNFLKKFLKIHRILNFYILKKFSLIINGRKIEYCKDGIAENQKDAVHYYKMAADKGNARGMFNYALLLLFHMNNPENSETNQKEALRYFKLSADIGYHPLMFLQGSILSHGSHGVAIDKESAEKYNNTMLIKEMSKR